MKKTKVLLPLAVLGACAVAAVWLLATKEEVPTRRAEPLVPLVRVARVAREDVVLQVSSEGSVRPRTQGDLVLEVAGRVVSASASWVDGGFFAAGDVLLEIDPTDHELALARAGADVARAELALAREEEEAKVALREWASLGEGRGEPPPLVARVPQLAEARAIVAAAQAARKQAEIDLERTRLRAPYAGRVRRKHIDVGQYVSRGAAAASIYSVDEAEVRLPVPASELAYVDIPLGYRGEGEGVEAALPAVTLRADFAGKEHSWRGRIARTEGEIDPESRRVYAVARIEDPYARGGDPPRPPLAAGLFVRAEIEGRRLEEVVILPRHALRGEARVLVVEEGSAGSHRLRFRDVDVLRRESARAIIGAGLAEGEIVCVSPLDVVVEGMKVRIEGDKEPAGGAQSEGTEP
jgi:RND family efflux transporter MFP subunit